MASARKLKSGGQKANGGCGLIIFGVIWTVFCGFMFSTAITGITSSKDDSAWPSATCEIEYFEIVDSAKDDSPFSLRARYTYHWEGQQYTSTKVTLKESKQDDYIDLVDQLESYRRKELQQCFVNPENPSEAVLTPSFGFDWSSVIFSVVGACFTAVGIGMIIFGIRSKRKEKQELSSQADKEGGKAIIIPFFTIFALAGLGILFFVVVPMWQTYFAAKSWVETPATVIWSEVRTHRGDDSTTYSPDIFYRYSFERKIYKSNTRGLMGSSSSSGRSAKQAIVNAHPADKEITCFVNPERPHETLLERNMGWWAAFTLFPLPFAAIGIGGLWFTIRKKKKISARSAASALRESPATNEYASPFRSKQAHKKFSPGKKRFFWLLGALAIAAFWNGIISVFIVESLADWKNGNIDWFMVPFILVGLALLLHVFYRLLACFNPAPKLILLPGEIEIGSIALLKWSVANGGHKLNHFAIYLVGEEEARYRRGTDTVTETEIFYEQALIDTKSPREVSSGTAEIKLPLETVPSWKSTNNAIKWSLRVRGDIPLWPDISDNYDITVTATNSHE